MHTEGVEERIVEDSVPAWFVRWKCGCGLWVGLESSSAETERLVDRLMWTDEARHRLERFPPYVAPLVQEKVEAYARLKQWRVIAYERLMLAQAGDSVIWDAEAEQRLLNVPAAVRAMARVELERTAADRGESRVTVALMEAVKARYFGMGQKS
jgi:hypothetical protein